MDIFEFDTQKPEWLVRMEQEEAAIEQQQTLLREDSRAMEARKAVQEAERAELAGQRKSEMQQQTEDLGQKKAAQDEIKRLAEDQSNLMGLRNKLESKEFEQQLQDTELKEWKETKDKADQAFAEAKNQYLARERALEANKMQQMQTRAVTAISGKLFNEYMDSVLKQIHPVSTQTVEEENRKREEFLKQNEEIAIKKTGDIRALAKSKDASEEPKKQVIRDILAGEIEREDNAMAVNPQTQAKRLGIRSYEEYEKAVHLLDEEQQELTKMDKRYTWNFNYKDDKLPKMEEQDLKKMRELQEKYYVNKDEAEIKSYTKDCRDGKHGDTAKEECKDLKMLEKRYAHDLHVGMPKEKENLEQFETSMLQKVNEENKKRKAILANPPQVATFETKNKQFQEEMEKFEKETEKQVSAARKKESKLEFQSAVYNTADRAIGFINERFGLLVEGYAAALVAGRAAEEEKKLKKMEEEYQELQKSIGSVFTVLTSDMQGADLSNAIVNQRNEKLGELEKQKKLEEQSIAGELSRPKEEGNTIELKEAHNLNTNLNINEVEKEISIQSGKAMNSVNEFAGGTIQYNKQFAKLWEKEKEIEAQREKLAKEKQAADAKMAEINKALSAASEKSGRDTKIDTLMVQKEAEVRLKDLTDAFAAGKTDAMLETAVINRTVAENYKAQAQQIGAEKKSVQEQEFVAEFTEATKNLFTPGNISKLEMAITGIEACYKLYSKAKKFIGGSSDDNEKKDNDKEKDEDKEKSKDGKEESKEKEKEEEEISFKDKLDAFREKMEGLAETVNGGKDTKTIADTILDIARSGQEILGGVKGKVDTLADQKQDELNRHQGANKVLYKAYDEWQAHIQSRAQQGDKTFKTESTPLWRYLENLRLNGNENAKAEAAKLDGLKKDAERLSAAKDAAKQDLTAAEAESKQRTAEYNTRLKEIKEDRLSPIEEMMAKNRQTAEEKEQLAKTLDSKMEKRSGILAELDVQISEIDRGVREITRQIEAKKEVAEKLSQDLERLQQKMQDAKEGKGVYFLAKLTGADPDSMTTYPEKFYDALDKVYINGLSATEYFRAFAPELHIDRNGESPDPDAASKVGDRIKGFLDAAKSGNSMNFVAVEGSDGKLKTVMAEHSNDPEVQKNIDKYNRIATQMYGDMNLVRTEALQGSKKTINELAAGDPLPDKMTERSRQEVMESAVKASTGDHRRRKINLSILSEPKETSAKAEGAARFAEKRNARLQGEAAQKSAGRERK